MADDDAGRAAKTFNRILNQPKLSASGSRTDKNVEDGIKKLRRLILVDGIPNQIVRVHYTLPTPIWIWIQIRSIL